MFADDTNLFSSYKYMKMLFKNPNDKLEKPFYWFKAKNLSLNDRRTKFTLFYSPRDKYNPNFNL